MLNHEDAKNCHFSIAFVCSGNDLTKVNMSKAIIDEIVMWNVKYCVYLANTYKEHDFYVFPITPIDETKEGIDENLITRSYKTANSNSLKRERFASTIKEQLPLAAKEAKLNNLKYANGFYTYLLKNSSFVGERYGTKYTGNEKYYKLDGTNPKGVTAVYRTYDGKHYSPWGCRIVFEKILTTCGLVYEDVEDEFKALYG